MDDKDDQVRRGADHRNSARARKRQTKEASGRGVDRHGDSAMAPGDPDRVALHCQEIAFVNLDTNGGSHEGAEPMLLFQHLSLPTLQLTANYRNHEHVQPTLVEIEQVGVK